MSVSHWLAYVLAILSLPPLLFWIGALLWLWRLLVVAIPVRSRLTAPTPNPDAGLPLPTKSQPERGNLVTKYHASPAQLQKTLRGQFGKFYDQRKIGNISLCSIFDDCNAMRLEHRL